LRYQRCARCRQSLTADPSGLCPGCQHIEAVRAIGERRRLMQRRDPVERITTLCRLSRNDMSRLCRRNAIRGSVLSLPWGDKCPQFGGGEVVELDCPACGMMIRIRSRPAGGTLVLSRWSILDANDNLLAEARVPAQAPWKAMLYACRAAKSLAKLRKFAPFVALVAPDARTLRKYQGEKRGRKPAGSTQL